MRIKTTVQAALACLCLGMGAAQAQAQSLPDLRGRNLSLTGNLTASGTILFGLINISSFLPTGGVPITIEAPANLTLNNSGVADNSNLTGSSAIGTFDSTVNGVFYPGFPNPTVPLTGSFNRTTGKFTLSGTLSGLSVIDFGVHDFSSAGFGIKRALIQFTNLGLALHGTGAVDSFGAFRITNAASDSFTFTSSNSTPALSLQDPALKTFQTSGDYPIARAAFALNNWTAQAILSGNLALDGVADLTKISAAAPLGSVAFRLSLPGSTAPVFSGSATLETAAGSANGKYYLPGAPFGTFDVALKTAKNLRVLLPNVTVNGSATLNDALLPAGDADNSNTVDVLDFGILVNAYGSDSAVSGSGYDPTADFNYDGKVDVLDFGLLVNSYGSVGSK